MDKYKSHEKSKKDSLLGSITAAEFTSPEQKYESSPSKFDKSSNLISPMEGVCEFEESDTEEYKIHADDLLVGNQKDTDSKGTGKSSHLKNKVL